MPDLDYVSIEKHGLSRDVADLGAVLVYIVEFRYIDPFLARCNGAEGNIRVNPVAQGNHAPCDSLQRQGHGHVGKVDGHHKIEGIGNPATHKIRELLENDVLPREPL